MHHTLPLSNSAKSVITNNYYSIVLYYQEPTSGGLGILNLGNPTLTLTSTHFVASNAQTAGTFYYNGSNRHINVYGTSALNQMTGAEFKQWLTDNGVLFYYALATPTDTEITNPLLVAQLDNFYNKAVTYANTTYIDVDGDLPVILDVDVFQNNLASTMAGINARFDRLIDPPVITMTSTDPGEGQPLEDNHFIAVYNN